MQGFHKNLNIMSIFTAFLLICALLFWRTVFNIAVTNVLLNGVILGTTIFGIGLCFANMFRLVPEYKWLHAYFDGRSGTTIAPRLLRPIALALHNKHLHITTTNLTELLDLVMNRIEDDRDSVRYITNTLIFLGLLGTFWGLILTVGGFAQLLMNIDFEDANVLTNMQIGMAGPLSGMATAFTSSLLGLAGSLIVGFLGLQLQFAQNTMFQELSDFMSQYVLQKPETTPNVLGLAESAPVNEETYTKISEIYDAFIDNGYEIRDLVKIDGKYPAIVAIGSNEKLFVATTVADADVLHNALKRIELCFADTLEGIEINTKIICVSGKNIDLGKGILHFMNPDSLRKYLEAHKNIRPKSVADIEAFEAYSEYINTTMEYLFKPIK